MFEHAPPSHDWRRFADLSCTLSTELWHALWGQAGGYDLSNPRARQIDAEDFEAFDLILVMDWGNLALVQIECPAEHQNKVRRFTEFCLQFDSPVVPDPYYGGEDGFEQVLNLVEDASKGLLRHVRFQLT